MPYSKLYGAIGPTANDGTKRLGIGTALEKLNFPFFLLSVYSHYQIICSTAPKQAETSHGIICSEITIN
jgi:hypothetical protein